MQTDILPTLNDIANRYYSTGDGTRKSPTYFKVYQELLADQRLKPLRVLELGVSSGASLLVWRDYLPNANIVGIDISEMPSILQNQDRIHFVRGSQDDVATLRHAASVAGGSFDLIVDDASHIGYLTKRSLYFLFPRFLVPGGVYVIEDFGTGFLAEYPDGAVFSPPSSDDMQPQTKEFRSSQHGMVGVVKQLVEHMMQELMAGSQPYLMIERLIIETNIVFIRKSRPSLLTDSNATGLVPPNALEINVLTEMVSSLQKTMDQQSDLLTHYRELLRLSEERQP